MAPLAGVTGRCWGEAPVRAPPGTKVAAFGLKTNSFALGLSLDLTCAAAGAGAGVTAAAAAAEAIGGVGGASAATAGVGGVDGSSAAALAAPLIEMLGMWAAVAPPGDEALLMWPPLGGE